MKKTIGVFAHVDAGKTTFCEALLFQAYSIKSMGRVDHKNTFLDYNEIEKKRGITIFSDIAYLQYGKDGYYLIDTPGHTDFSSEMERALLVLDAAIIIVSGTDGVQSHTLMVYRLLKERQIPIYFFINKTDLPTADLNRCLDDINTKLAKDVLYLATADHLWEETTYEWLCGFSEAFFDHYAQWDSNTGGVVDKALMARELQQLIGSGEISFALSGSALTQKGVGDLMAVMSATLAPPPPKCSNFAARVFKVRYDDKQTRLTFLKCLSGSLKVKDELDLGNGNLEKIHEIRSYHGPAYNTVQEAMPGDIVAVTGLTKAAPGQGLGECCDAPAPFLVPALKASVVENGHTHDDIMACLRKLEAEDPLLKADFEQATGKINVCIMGKIQLEILKEVLWNRFGLQIDFGECSIVYKETVASPVMGYGHYEPLRHYGEVHVHMAPNPGKGLDFESQCPTDFLPRQYQHLIRDTLLTYDHKGVLTGSSLTDVRFVLKTAAYHLKHTEGGDLREAALRAVRQGLEKAESVLLEPYYTFRIDAESGYMGRILSDITRLNGTFSPPEFYGENVVIKGKGPVETFMAYAAEFLSVTKGTGAISMHLLGYFPCHDPDRIIAAIAYEKDRDLENVSSSIFCSKGAGFEVKWYDAEKHMHLLK